MQQRSMIAGVLLGLIVGVSLGWPRLGVSKAAAAPGLSQRYAYLCFAAQSLDDLNAKANAAGLRGWEMTTATSGQDGAGIWCFRQRR